MKERSCQIRTIANEQQAPSEEEGFGRALAEHQSMKLVAFYGTLMRAFDVQRLLGLESQLRFISPCKIPGKLYDLGAYPGLVEDEGIAQGDLFELLSSRVLDRLDEFEDYDPAQPQSSEYNRRAVRLVEPETDAWVYVYNRPVDARRLNPSGAWAFDERRAEAIRSRIIAWQGRSS